MEERKIYTLNLIKIETRSFLGEKGAPFILGKIYNKSVSSDIKESYFASFCFFNWLQALCISFFVFHSVLREILENFSHIFSIKKIL